MKRLLLTALYFLAVLIIVLATYFMSMHRQIVVAKSDSKGQLEASQRVFLAEIQKYKHLPFVISQERTILRLFEGRADPFKAGVLLKAIRIRSGASVVYVTNDQGLIIASSNYDQPNSFVGMDYGFHPYFKRAMNGQEGSMYAFGGVTGAPGYYLSSPIALKSVVVGVAVVKFELSELQGAWRASSSIIVAKDPYGVIALSSKKDWLYRTLEPMSVSQLERARKGRLYSGTSIAQLGVSTGVSLGAKWIEIDGTRYLFSVQRIRQKRWELLAFVPWAGMVDHSIRVSLIVGLATLVVGAGLQLFRAHRQKKHMERRIRVSRRTRRIDRKREESLRQLADSIAHQIRNPLLGIGGNASLLKRKLTDDEGVDEYLQTIMDCCQDLEQVVVSVRDYIDIIPTSVAPFDLESQIEMSRSTAMDEVVLPAGSVAWVMDIESAVLPLDAVLMGKALHEVLCNALEAKEDDTITIRVTGKWSVVEGCTDEFEIPNEKCYMLTICDSGRGIDAETFKHVMDPFFSTKPHGTGLGLAKAKRVLQIFHGGFSIISPVPDHAECRTMVEMTLSFPIDSEME